MFGRDVPRRHTQRLSCGGLETRLNIRVASEYNARLELWPREYVLYGPATGILST